MQDNPKERKKLINSIFPEELINSNTYRYQARFRMKDYRGEYYKYLGENMKYYREKANLTINDIAKYLGINGIKYENWEIGNYRGIEFIIIHEFCAIVNVDFKDFLDRFQKIWFTKVDNFRLT